MGTLRLILAIAVIDIHIGGITTKSGWFLYGPTAVQSFFILSGFYMGLVLNGHYRDRPATDFWKSRFLRIYPTYFIFAAAELLFQFGERFDHLLAKAPWDTWLFVVVTNLTLIGKDLAMFLKAIWSQGGHLEWTAQFFPTEFPPLYKFVIVPPSWTISIELWFYMVAPLFLRGFRLTLLVLLAALCLRITLALSGYYADPWNYRFAPSELLFFAIGGLTYFAYARINWAAHPKFYRRLGFLACIVLSYLAIQPEPLFPQFLSAALDTDIRLFGIENALYLALVTLALPFMFLATRGSRFDRELGDWSYIFYIGHFFFMLALEDHLEGLAMRLVVLALLTLSSIIIVRLVEKPINRLRSRAYGARIQG